MGKKESEHFFEELEVNDYPQQARWKATQKESVSQVQERTECSVITRGRYVAPGQEHTLEAGERKLYLLIEGKTELAVRQARREFQRILDEETLRVGARPQFGRYSVL
eukprot:evm.model.NODE_10065_length_18107_cov_36.126194.3